MPSPDAVIELRGLRKEYRRLRGGRTVAVDGLDLAVAEGGVFGFLGPNGAGKTTTIRCLLGLARPTAGSARLLGAEGSDALARVMPRVGSLVETPQLFPGFSGRRNLALLGRVLGIGRQRVGQVLDLVGLGERADDKVRSYSLGMKQRLGLGVALLRDPDVLILDEPANGLDPAGIKEVRDLLRGLAGEGRTIFVSSHLLTEVQQVCDRVAILARGRCIAAGTVEEVLAHGRSARLVVAVADPVRAVDVLGGAGIPAQVGVDQRLMVEHPAAGAAQVTQVLAAAGLFLSELRPEQIDLETVFLELTGDRPPAETKDGTTE